jgi:hypothetical protein
MVGNFGIVETWKNAGAIIQKEEFLNKNSDCREEMFTRKNPEILEID